MNHHVDATIRAEKKRRVVLARILDGWNKRRFYSYLLSSRPSKLALRENEKVRVFKRLEANQHFRSLGGLIARQISETLIPLSGSSRLHRHNLQLC